MSETATTTEQIEPTDTPGGDASYVPPEIPDDADEEWFQAECEKIVPTATLTQLFIFTSAYKKHIGRQVQMVSAERAVAAARLHMIDLQIAEAKRKGLWTDEPEAETA